MDMRGLKFSFLPKNIKNKYIMQTAKTCEWGGTIPDPLSTHFYVFLCSESVRRQSPIHPPHAVLL